MIEQALTPIRTKLSIHRPAAVSLLFQLARPHWKLVASAFSANVVSALLEGTTLAALTLALQVLSNPPGSLLPWLNDAALRWGKEPLFLALILSAIAAQFLRSGFQFLSETAAVSLQAFVQAEAYARIYRHIVRLPFQKISSYRLGDLTNYISQAEQLHEICGRLNELARTFLLVAVYAGLLFWLSWPLTLVAVAAYWVISRLFRNILTAVVRHAHTYVQNTVRLNEQTTEFLQATRLIHTFGRQEETLQTVSGLARDGIASRRKATLWSNAVEPITDSLTVLGAGAFLICGYFVMGAGWAPALSRLLAFLMALYRVTPRLRGVYAGTAVLASLLPNIARLSEIMEEPEEAPDSARGAFPGLRNSIEFRGVSMRYLPDEPQVLERLSFEVPRGSFTALVGVSGTGKSTVIDLLLRLFDPTAGQILVDGEPLSSYTKVSWRERLGVVAQDTFLFHASIRENIAFGRPGAGTEDVTAAARAAHADAFIQRLGNGYETAVGDRGYRLSGGQCQRLALARALIRRPDILILDEATSSLDSESERLIQQALEQQRGQRTIFAIAHRLSTVAHADQILVLAEGHLAEQGTHAQLLRQGGVYARLWKLQSEDRIEFVRKELVS